MFVVSAVGDCRLAGKDRYDWKRQSQHGVFDDLELNSEHHHGERRSHDRQKNEIAAKLPKFGPTKVFAITRTLQSYKTRSLV